MGIDLDGNPYFHTHIGGKIMNQQFMKALVYEGPKVMVMRELPIPEIGEDEVLIRIEQAGICGSELSGYLGHNSLRKPPLVMGHEFAGSVIRTGDKTEKFAIGDRVTANPLVSCGICFECLQGLAHLCEHRKLIGAHRPGAYAEYVAVPERNLLHLPDHISYEEGALAEPFACAVHVCRLLQLSPEDRLLIVGAGPIGLCILLTAKIFGLNRIMILDKSAERIEIAEQLGAISVTNETELERVHPETGFSAVVDAVGMTVTRQLCVQAVRPGGRVAFTGLHEADSSLPVNLAIRNEIKMVGAFAYAPADFIQALQWINEGRVKRLPYIVHAPLEDGAVCFEKLVTNPGKVSKIILDVK